MRPVSLLQLPLLRVHGRLALGDNNTAYILTSALTPLSRATRWKQRDIHEKRELRKLKLEHLGLETIMNNGLLARVATLISSTAEQGPDYITRTVAELTIKVPDFKTRQFKDGEQPSEDHMILALLSQVVAAIQKDGKGPEGRKERLLEELREHEAKLNERNVDIQKETVELIKEGQKYITSDDLHVGFESKTVSK